MTRCNSGTDSKVWMEEDAFLRIFCLKIFASSGIFVFIIRKGAKTMENLSFVLTCVAIFAVLIIVAALCERLLCKDRKSLSRKDQ